MADRRPSPRLLVTALMLATGLALAGCSGAPSYRPVAVATPPAFREDGPWAEAAPVDPALGRDWWRALGDPQLDALEARLETDSPTLAVALARREEANAALRTALADRLPTIGTGSTLTYDRQSDDRPLRGSSQESEYGANTLQGSISYEVDLWGRVRSEVAAGRANAQASIDDVEAIRLSLQADLASLYIALRGLDAETELLTGTVDAYAQADAVVRARFRGGVATGIDTGRSGAQLADAQAQLADVRATRARVEHAIASLVGTPASAFSLPQVTGTLHLAAMPVGLPSTLLQRRPDVAAAERRVYAANRSIGVAKAAFFPLVNLGGTGGTNATTLAGLVASPNAFWALGPTIALTVFDGGRRHAALRTARAKWAEASATYRGTALKAFQEVEDSLSSLHHYGDEENAETRAASEAQQAADLSMIRYTKGAATYLDVVTAQTAALAARRRAIEVHTLHLGATVSLARAVGGGWSATNPQTPRKEG
ncbi:RND efflux system, outer membrane lipoprotein, NodT [Novosphingobium nitrogenifigens DSM 19370]|uniref:RND efflux system, outer membrane lipoprotein, NodT n=1 Tax=Novosphingobium nitrogenifigens DSM 19370 TaxID=983920 RepID=F1Z516_9SPHN|nr:efflux transporter outer membrane subunit [Novosphingobium nitrogenifigens]EGD60055.1 RND efflux system, outer membrane lipoprotein, NodT [Novosphingobium nitrogenifigens DSM 19370]